MNNQQRWTALAIGGLSASGLLFATASATPEEDLHCEGHNVAPNVKDESGADDNNIVPEIGTLICVKASTSNTGIIVADGETTLQEYLFQAGIVDGSGTQGRDVSYWVIYPPTTTSSSSTSFPSTTQFEVTTTPTTAPSTTQTTQDEPPDTTTTTTTQPTTTTTECPDCTPVTQIPSTTTTTSGDTTTTTSPAGDDTTTTTVPGTPVPPAPAFPATPTPGNPSFTG
jgi:hypothetical protein